MNGVPNPACGWLGYGRKVGSEAGIIAHIMKLLCYGLIAMSDIMPKESIPATNDIIEGIAVIMDSALTPASGSDSETGKTILNQIADSKRHQFQEQ